MKQKTKNKLFSSGNWSLEMKNGYLTIKSDNGDFILPDWDTNEDRSIGVFINQEKEIANFKLMAAAKEMYEALKYYKDGIDHLYKCIDFGKSFLDAEAISFMNESGIKINNAIKNAETAPNYIK